MRLLILVLLASFSVATNAQSFQGKAIYKTSRKSNFKMKTENSEISDKEAAQIEARIRKMNQKTFVLEFDNFSSTYKEEAKLKSPNPKQNGARVMVMSFGGSGSTDVYYKNIKEKRFVNQTEIMGKRFLVKDEFEPVKWEMTTETKNIGKYTCYKATYTLEQENTKISMVNGEVKQVKEKVDVTTTAWYTLDIPVSNGPSNYQGLPGLILEVNDGTTTIVCNEIILNPSDKIKISEPEKGKIVSQEKYEKISSEKSKEMLERFKSRKGHGIEIKVGG